MTSRLKRRFIIKGPLFSSFLNNKSELSFPVSSSQRVSCQENVLLRRRHVGLRGAVSSTRRRRRLSHRGVNRATAAAILLALGAVC